VSKLKLQTFGLALETQPFQGWLKMISHLPNVAFGNVGLEGATASRLEGEYVLKTP